jgi:antitoxin component YwqK of YwqJK toxin-antitoxin module
MKYSLKILLLLLFFSCYEEEVYYSPAGKLHQIKRYLEQQKLTSTTTFYYDELGRLAKETLGSDGDNGEIFYFYNKEGRLSEKQNLIPGRRDEVYYNYNEAGQLLKVIGIRTESYFCFYDNLGRLSALRYFSSQNKPQDDDPPDSIFYKDEFYQYDSVDLDKITDVTVFRKTGQTPDHKELDRHLKYLYNSDGLLEEIKLIDGKTFLSRSTLEYYIYDSQNRLHRKLYYDLNMGSSWFGLDRTDTYFYNE